MRRGLALLVPSMLAAATAPALTLPAASGAGSRLELENPWVRVWRSKPAPHEKTPLAEHLPAVRVFLTDVHQRVTGGDGQTRDDRHVAGSVAYRDAGTYAEENAANRPAEIIVVELKSGAPPSPAISLDPVKLDPKYHTVPLENDRVRVLRTVLEPHGAAGWAGLGHFLGDHPGQAATTAISLETAHPAKFPEEIRALIQVDPAVPASLTGLDAKPERFRAMETDYRAFKDFLLREFRR